MKKRIVLKKFWSQSECIKEWEKLLDEGRDVGWGQYPEGWFELTEDIDVDDENEPERP